MKKNRTPTDSTFVSVASVGRASTHSLEGALAAWKTRSTASEQLTSHLNADARHSLKSRVYEQHALQDAPVSVWSPALRWAIALGLPALAIFSLLGLQQLNPEPNGSTSAASVHATESVRIQVSKENGEIVFRAANSRIRRVVKSSRADGFDAGAETMIQDGRFSDSLETGGNLTFYRID